MISIEVVIALDFPYNFIQEKYQGYLEYKRMCKLIQIYEEARYLHGYKIIYNSKGPDDDDIKNVLYARGAKSEAYNGNAHSAAGTG
jgi:hypothetical protein